jgi:2'-5' RNA ligase
MPRLFTGLEIPQDVGFELAMMRGGVRGARWIEPDAYHITLRFIGDIGDRLAHDIAHELDGVTSPAFAMRLKGVGAFGGRKPRAIYAGMAECRELMRLQAAHERLLQRLGLEAEGRKYSPHVTLARLNGADPASVQTYVASHSLYCSRPIEVARFVLFSSRPSRGGGPYAIEESYMLGEAARQIPVDYAILEDE